MEVFKIYVLLSSLIYLSSMIVIYLWYRRSVYWKKRFIATRAANKIWKEQAAIGSIWCNRFCERPEKDTCSWYANGKRLIYELGYDEQVTNGIIELLNSTSKGYKHVEEF